MNSFLPVEIPQSSMAGQQRLLISELQFDKFTTPSSSVYWKMRFKTQVSSCSEFPPDALFWSKAVDMVDIQCDLKSSRSTKGTQLQNFELLDARIASA